MIDDGRVHSADWGNSESRVRSLIFRRQQSLTVDESHLIPDWPSPWDCSWFAFYPLTPPFLTHTYRGLNAFFLYYYTYHHSLVHAGSFCLSYLFFSPRFLGNIEILMHPWLLSICLFPWFLFLSQLPVIITNETSHKDKSRCMANLVQRYSFAK
jgi:hypothetical protein